MSDREDEYQRDLYRFCAETAARRWTLRTVRKSGAPRWDWILPRAKLIADRLLAALADVPDLGVLIRKAEPDMMAFAQSRGSPDAADEDKDGGLGSGRWLGAEMP